MASEADLETEQLIATNCCRPSDGFLGETAGSTSPHRNCGWSTRRRSAVNGLDWCVSIAFVQAGILQFGLVYDCPDELLSGRWFAATRNGRPISPSRPPASEGSPTWARPAVGLTRWSRCSIACARGPFIRYGSGALGLSTSPADASSAT